jgi:putative peptide zinc metalloprotease protein
MALSSAVTADASPMPASAPAPSMPPLREELRLHRGPADREGTPRWTLEDPARNRFFQIGWAEMEMLARWHLGQPDAIAAAVSAETPLEIDAEEVTGFARFLASCNLLQVCGAEAQARLTAQANAGRMGWGKWLLKNYLFMRIPLVRPDAWLGRMLPLVAPLYSRAFLWLTLFCGTLGLFLAARQWDVFVTTFLHFFSLEGAALAGITLFCTKVLHELGHGFTAKRYGCRVSSMGVALLVMWPVLYTDTSGAWKLRDKNKRLAIGAAGMAVELALACYATLAWSFLPDGVLRSAAFMLGTTTWLMTLAINLNPFMRFDGYFLTADGLDIANLQDRSFALARWRLREALFRFGEEKPEHLSPGLERLLIAYAIGTWVYRFFLFLGIALLVYHVFFKLLGIFLFMVEIAWFIGRPIWGELMEWHKRGGTYRWNSASMRTAGAFGLLLLALLLPWRGSVEAPALLRAAEQVQLYAPTGARLEEMTTSPGSPVTAGQVLYRLHDPELSHRLDMVERELVRLRWQNSFLVLDREAGASLRVVREEYATATAKRAALLMEQQRLTIKAPFDGVMADQATPLATGEWLGMGEWLGTLVDEKRVVVEAYVGERDLLRLQQGAKARFLADAGDQPPVDLVLAEIATAATTRLASVAELSSPHGGGIAAIPDQREGPVPEQAVYRVLLVPPPGDTATAITMARRGSVDIAAERRSPLGEIITHAIALLRRESGF